MLYELSVEGTRDKRLRVQSTQCGVVTLVLGREAVSLTPGEAIVVAGAFEDAAKATTTRAPAPCLDCGCVTQRDSDFCPSCELRYKTHSPHCPCRICNMVWEARFAEERRLDRLERHRTSTGEVTSD